MLPRSCSQKSNPAELPKKHQHDGFEQGFDHFLDRNLNERRRIQRVVDAYAGREKFSQIRQLRADRLGRHESIRGGRQTDGHGRGRTAVHASLRAITLATQLDPGDVTQ